MVVVVVYYVNRDAVDSVDKSVAPMAKEIESTGSNYPGTSGNSVFADASDEQNGVPDSMVEEVIRLHAQQFKLEQMQDDLDAIVMVRDGNSDLAMSARELQSLHARQHAEAELGLGVENEIVIPGDSSGSAALSVADLRSLHEQQHNELQSAGVTNDIVIAGSHNGVVFNTHDEIEALHALQKIEQENDVSLDNLYAAPLSTDGAVNLTVRELKALHESQSGD